MKVLKLNTPFKISAVVRIAPTLGDVLTFTATNEFSAVTQDYTIDWSLVNARLNFTLPDTNTDFKAGNKYEISIKNTTTDKVIYLGKMIVVKEITDTQNYTPSTQTTPRFE